MLDEHEYDESISAAEARSHLAELEAERAMAVAYNLVEVDTYMGDLDDEIEIWRHLYVISAVTEIAVLRGELWGRDLG